MLGITLAILLQASVAGETTTDYNTAFKAASENGKPMLVLVGTDWCPACVTMKQSIIPRLQRAGRLSGVVYTEVDADAQPRIARRIMSGGGYPQLALYRKTKDGWKRQILIGVQSETTITTLVDRAVSAQESEGKLEVLPISQ
ncbi:thioredoxin family protein [Bremerella sp. T1]|uniref:thioredoxin family protein n=1 Tax=Bremerella sp. TYQ1 TaxID=3119568 RepID=UPI001CCE2E64|nr:thioredoxin family protein [Bremerella volcania]UBM37526.1 thioredoxin family protein [Bremerella volcania]